MVGAGNGHTGNPGRCRGLGGAVLQVEAEAAVTWIGPCHCATGWTAILACWRLMNDFVQAFFTGGKHKGRMIAVDVGLPESAEPVAEYGGARRLLEGFLSGMDVCPAQPDQSQPGCP